MRAFLLILIMSFSVNVAMSQSDVPKGKTRLVKALIESRKAGFEISYYSKQNLRLGDSLSVALMKIFTQEEMLLKENVSICLSIIEKSFYDLEAIEKQKDRIPLKTIWLLEKLSGKAKDAESKDLINKTLNKVIELTKPPKPAGK